MVSFAISSSPLLLLYIFAIWISRKQYNSQPNLSTLCIIIFSAKFLFRVFFILIRDPDFLYNYDIDPDQLQQLARQIAPIVSIGLDAALLFCVFAWRKQSGGHYKKPAIIAVAVIVSILLLDFVSGPVFVAIVNWMDIGGIRSDEFQSMKTITSLIFSCLFAAGFLASLFAVYGWRGNDFNNELLYRLSLKADPNVRKKEGGTFNTVDYVPFLVGLFVFGGLLFVPLIWSEFIDTSYPKAVFPAFVSCAMFAYCHDRQGQFIFTRLVAVSAYIAYVMFKLIALNIGTSSGEPFFVAGGLLAYPIMYGSGWIGIVIVRLAKRLIMGPRQIA